MTDHPLTDEIMYELHGNKRGYSNPFDADDMRAAYDLGFEKADKGSIKYVIRAFSEGHDKGSDDQLEKVIEWLKDNMRKYVYQDYYGADEHQEVFKTLEYLRKAMRPTTQEDN